MKARPTAFFVAWLLIELVGAVDEYAIIAARLNCSKLVIDHEGVKSVAISRPSIPSGLVLPEEQPPPLKRIAKKQPLQHRIPADPPFSGSELSPDVGVDDDLDLPVDVAVGDKNDCHRDEGKEVPECAFAFDDDGSPFNWYQVLVENGGPPGECTKSTLRPGRVEVLDPCHRPITDTSPPSGGLLYDYELMTFEKVYRREKAFLRFAGTSSEFVDVDGELVWPPPHTQRRYYRLSYRKDDTGFYVKVHKRQKCEFEAYPSSVNCRQVEDFTACEKNMYNARNISPGLLAALVGRGK